MTKKAMGVELFCQWHGQRIIGSSSIYGGELSFLQPVHFCICWHNSAILTGYLFQHLPACVHAPSWKNFLGVSTVMRYVW